MYIHHKEALAKTSQNKSIYSKEHMPFIILLTSNPSDIP